MSLQAILVATLLSTAAPAFADIPELRPPPAGQTQTVAGGKPPLTVEEAILALVAWHDDPVLFVQQVFGAAPDPWQADALRAIVNDPRVAMSACKGPGKSCLLAWTIWWFMATREDAQIIVTSITAPNLKDNLWKELAVWQAKSPYLVAVFDLKAERITQVGRPKTWWCSARAFGQDADASQQANTLAGFHGQHVMVVLDEVGDYPDGVVVAAEGIFANVVEAKLVVAGNPTRTDGPLYRIVTKDRKRWTVVYITGDPDDPKRSPRISLEWARQMIEDWGRDNPWVMVNVLGLFPPQAADKLLGANDVMLAQERDVPVHAFRSDARIWGLDPARFGDDASCLCRRQGQVARRFVQWRNLDGPQLADRVGAMLLEADKAGELPDALFVDVGGVGSSAYDHLKLLGWSDLVHAIDFAGSPDDERFANKRAEIWWDMAQWVKKSKGCLPTDPELPGQLTAPSFKFRPVGKRTRFILESKEDLRARGVSSPDRADSLALTFSGSVMPRSRSSRTLEQRGQQAVTSYDPYAT